MGAGTSHRRSLLLHADKASVVRSRQARWCVLVCGLLNVARVTVMVQGRATDMPWRQPRRLPEAMRHLALQALEHGLQVSIEDEDGSLKLWVSHPDLRVYQVVSTHEGLDTFVQKWTHASPTPEEHDAL